MKEFRYSALTASGKTISGIRRSASADQLASELLQQGLIMLRSKPTLGSLGAFFSGSRRVNREELRDFTQHMATCLGAGIPAVTALADFQSQAQGDFAEILGDIRGDVSSGTQLDESFAKHPEVFAPVYLALVAAGQNSGGLDSSFEELVGYLEWTDNLRSQTTQALIYPSILVSGIVGLFLLLMLFVIPRFDEVFSQVDFELPALTVGVLATGRFLGHWWWLFGVVIAAVTVTLKLYFKTTGGTLVRDRIQLSIPVYGTFVQKIALSRFARTFSLIFSSGVDLLHLLDLLQGVVGNQVLARQLAVIRHRVSSGETLTEGFKDAKAFPPLIQRLVSVGEKTGSLDTALGKASEHLDREIPRDLKKTFMILETVVIALLGVLVCVAALSLLMPIMQIRGNIG